MEVTSDEDMSRAEEEEDEVEEATVEDVVGDEEEEAVVTVGEEVEEAVATAGEEVEEAAATAGKEVVAVAQEAIRPEVLLEKAAELLITPVHLQDPHMAKADPHLVAQGAEEEEEPLAIDMKEVQTTAGK